MYVLFEISTEIRILQYICFLICGRAMYYILFYRTVGDYIEKRSQYREEHLALAQSAHENGDLVLAGALDQPADGAILIFKGISSTIAEEFAKNDPYVKNGLITEWSVRPWTVVVGGE